MRFASGNPALSEEKFAKQSTAEVTDPMTVKGAVNKAFTLFLCVVLPALFVWNTYNFEAQVEGMSFHPLTWVGAIGGFILALVTIFMPKYSGYTAPLYAVLEGLFLGGLSGAVEMIFPGIVVQAIFLTMGILLTMLGLYRGGLIKATEKFRTGVMAATGAVAFVYLISWIMSMFGGNIPYIHEGGIIGIGFSLVVIVIASLNLILDFDMIEKGAEHKAPKYMEWYAAFGLMVTLIWLYVEVLKLLMKLSSRD